MRCVVITVMQQIWNLYIYNCIPLIRKKGRPKRAVEGIAGRSPATGNWQLATCRLCPIICIYSKTRHLAIYVEIKATAHMAVKAGQG